MIVNEEGFTDFNELSDVDEVHKIVSKVAKELTQLCLKSLPRRRPKT